MSENRSQFIGVLKRRYFIIVCMIIASILCISFIMFLISKNSNTQSVIVNMVGKQRMLTQKIAKDANRKYAILQTMKNGPFVQSNMTLGAKVALLNASIASSQSEFTRMLSALEKGVFTQDKQTIDFSNSLSQTRQIVTHTIAHWNTFQHSLDIIQQSNSVTDEVANALIYINTNNEELLSDCDQTVQIILTVQEQQARKTIVLSVILFVLSLAALLTSIYHLHRFIVIPLNEIYLCITDINVVNKNVSVPNRMQKELVPVIDEIHLSIDKINKLITLIKNLSSNMSFNDVLDYIYTSFSLFVPYSHIGIALLKENGRILEASYGISDPTLSDLPKKLLGLRVQVNETSLGKIIDKNRPRIINDLKAYLTNHPKREYNEILVNEGIQSSITLPLKLNNQAVGVIFFSSKTKNIYNKYHLEFLETLADSLAISLNQNIFIDELLYSGILALAKMADSRDEDTGDHLERIKTYTRKITEFLVADKKYSEELTTEFIRDLERFSPMHDIGKVGIKDGILLKPGKLTEEEFTEMKKHCVFGADVLRAAEGNISKQGKSMFQLGIEIAEGHHEKWDGSGYPFGKAGQNIPLSARIVAVADVFDALTSRRPYKEPFSFDTSFEILLKGNGQHFDPAIIESLVKHRNNLYDMYKKLGMDRVLVG